MSTLRANTLKPITSGNSLVLQGDSGGSGVSGPSIDSNGDVDFSQNTNAKVKLPSGGGIYESNGSTEILTESSGTVTLKNTALDSSVSLTGVTATQSEVFGTKKDASITSGTSTLTIASSSGISNGDFVVGQGITPGTTVSSGAGTTTLTLSANANEDLSSDPVMFYSSDKFLSPGLVGGMLCRAWVNFNGSGTVAIRGSANVSSITDHGTGDYSANFTTALPDASFCTVALPGLGNGNNTIGQSRDTENRVQTTTTTSVFVANANSTSAQDPPYVAVAVFR